MCTSKNKLDIKQAIDYIAEAWENVEQQTIRNCWDETGIVSNSNPESIQETRVAIQRGLGVLVNEIPNTLPTIFIDNEIRNSLVNYIHDQTSPPTEEILTDEQIIDMVQDHDRETPDTDNEVEPIPKVLPKEALDAIKKVILFYEQLPIDNGFKMDDFKIFRHYVSDLKARYITSLQQKSIEDYFPSN
ncbi:unnamed protein product [Rhizophagus irregularis]|nr:unnamed protein product [Rhizophagus irregularis]